MNEKPRSDKLLRLAPLVLRVGVAAVLIYAGFQRVAPMFSGGEVGQAVQADANGLAVNANWGDLIGVGQVAVGVLLGVGLLTRLTGFGVMVTSGYCAFEGLRTVDPETLGRTAILFQSHGPAILLLGAIGASLLVSGAGWLSLDNRLARRRSVDTVIAKV